MSFEERAVEMGLTNHGNGCFYYGDIHAEVAYRYVHTLGGANIMDNFQTPYLALFTKEAGMDPDNSWRFCGVVSDAYRFEGNEVLNETIRRGINQVGTSILREETSLTPDKTQMYNSIVIQNPTNVPQVGDIYPQVVVMNSYNGTKKKSIAFGLNMTLQETHRVCFGFRSKLGTLSQVHHQGHGTTMATPIGSYITAFAQNIVDLVQQNFNNRVTEEEMLSILDLVEKVGKRRREEISGVIQGMTESNQPMTSWQMFLALTRYSTLEGNLNAKRLIEDIAERVLVVPERMMSVVSTINS